MELLVVVTVHATLECERLSLDHFVFLIQGKQYNKTKITLKNVSSCIPHNNRLSLTPSVQMSLQKNYCILNVNILKILSELVI